MYHEFIMSKRGDIVTVDIERSIHEQLTKNAENRNLSLRKYVNEILLMSIEKDEFLREYAPYLSKLTVQDNILFIKDEKLNAIAQVYLKDHTLYCTLDESSDCMHIHFALALPELARLNHKKF